VSCNATCAACANRRRLRLSCPILAKWVANTGCHPIAFRIPPTNRVESRELQEQLTMDISSSCLPFLTMRFVALQRRSKHAATVCDQAPDAFELHRHTAVVRDIAIHLKEGEMEYAQPNLLHWRRRWLSVRLCGAYLTLILAVGPFGLGYHVISSSPPFDFKFKFSRDLATSRHSAVVQHGFRRSTKTMPFYR
jgi:hypothetical protein